MEKRLIECALHGKKEMTLLCTHLAHSLLNREIVGFHQYDDGDLGRPDAWCNLCEENLKKVTTDLEQERWFLSCDYKVLCTDCWDEVKTLNKP